MSESTLQIILEPAKIKRKFNIQEDELAALRKYGDKAKELNTITHFLDDFYAWLKTLPEYKQFFTDDSMIERVKRQQTSYWYDFFKAEITEQFLKSRHAIGMVHAKIKLPLNSYSAGVNFSTEWWLNQIYKSKLPKEQLQLVIRGFTKLVNIDFTIIAETFSQETNNKITKILDNEAQKVKAVTAIAEAVSVGDFSKRIEVKDEQDMLSQAINRIVDQIREKTQAIKKSEARSHGIIETAIDAIILIDENGILQSCNSATSKLFGYHEDEMIGKNVKMLMPTPYKDKHDGYLANHLRTGEKKIIGIGREIIGKRKDGSEFSGYLSVSDFVIGDKKVFAGILRDTTIEKKNEAVLKESEIKHRSIIETAIDGIILIDDHGIMQTCNSATTKLFGYSADELIGNNVSKLMPASHGHKHDSYIAHHMRTGEKKVIGIGRELIARHKDGKEFPIQLTINDIKLGDKTMFAGIVRDITVQKQAEENMRKANENLNVQNQLRARVAELYDSVRGELSTVELADNILSKLAQLIEVQVGTFYVFNKQKLELIASYAYKQRKNLSNIFNVGEGLVGQCAKEKNTIVISNVPDDYIKVSSGLGETTPSTIMVLPIMFEKQLLGVLEIAKMGAFSDDDINFLEEAAENIGVSFNSASARVQMKALLEETQTQQEELKASNEEMEEKTEELQRSQESLKTQAGNLRVSNEELEEKTKYLEEQRIDIEQKNSQIELAKYTLEQKAEDLELASKYKSEFLANMSHELRTPLNSLLILAKDLASNNQGNLTEHQLESANIIHSGGQDLLTLINDILDLSKVEAGKLSIQKELIALNNVTKNLERQFNPVAKNKKLKFTTEICAGTPSSCITDSVRIEQILKNLLSNAFKFTSEGSVILQIKRATADTVFIQSDLTHEQALAFSVTDTGIGIPEDKQRAIFEAFQQMDGSTSRKYGGTGLGLTISRQLAKLLGGEIQLSSQVDSGSTFTLYLPLESSVSEQTPSSSPITEEFKKKVEQNIPQTQSTVNTMSEFITDDRLDLINEDKSILIIEDDKTFAKILMDISRKKDYKCLVAGDGKSGLELAFKHKPSAIMLDINLPDIDGYKVLEQLKDNIQTRHIPVHVVSAQESNNTLLEKGAMGYLKKPASAEDIDQMFIKLTPLLKQGVKQVLVVDDNKDSVKAVTTLIKNKDIKILTALNGKEAEKQIKSKKLDCVILDLNLPDTTGFELLKKLSKSKKVDLPPVIIYTGRDLTIEENNELTEYAASIVVKGVNSSDRLLDETLLFLHSIEANLPSKQRKIIQMLHDPQQVLKDRKILLVDDDLRNTFALSSVLSNHGLDVVMADNGKRAIEKLETDPSIELVIMDVMMPVMDGNEAMRKIRSMKQFEKLPIIALTAKAMAEDRIECLNAGANDYLTKPVDTEILLALIKVWLFKEKDTFSVKRSIEETKISS